MKKRSISVKKEFLIFHDQSFKYIEKWFDFSDNNYQYKIQFLSVKKEAILTSEKLLSF